MHRRNDQNFPFELGQQLAAAIPNATFVPLDGELSHYSLGDQDAVLRAVLPFLPAAQGAAEPGTAPFDTAPTVRTVLVTDLVSHVEMMQHLGDEKGREVLREHERITRRVLQQHGGSEVKTMGDGFLASFASVTSAMECAVALQRAVDEPVNERGMKIDVRIGLNAGEPIEEDGDLFGATVILASRIAAQAGAGEILVPDTVRGLLSGKGFAFADRGEFVPKGFEDAVRLFEVRWRD